MYDKNKTATRIKELRKKADMSQEQLGKKLDMNKSTIQRYENAGVNKIKEPVIEKMAEILKTSSEYLLGVTDEPTLKSSNVISLGEKDLLISKLALLDKEKLLKLTQLANLSTEQLQKLVELFPDSEQ